MRSPRSSSTVSFNGLSRSRSLPLNSITKLLALLAASSKGYGLISSKD